MATRRLREPDAVYRFSVIEAQREVLKKDLHLTHEDFTKLCEEPWIKERAIRTANEMDLADRLMEEGLCRPYSAAKKMAAFMMGQFDEDLMPNLEEWLDNKPLSDIRLGGKSVNDIINMYEGVRIDIPRAILCLSKWKKLNYWPHDFCEWNFSKL